MHPVLRAVLGCTVAALLAAAIPAAPAAAQSPLENSALAHPDTGVFESHLQCGVASSAECWWTADKP